MKCSGKTADDNRNTNLFLLGLEHVPGSKPEYTEGKGDFMQTREVRSVQSVLIRGLRENPNPQNPMFQPDPVRFSGQFTRSYFGARSDLGSYSLHKKRVRARSEWSRGFPDTQSSARKYPGLMVPEMIQRFPVTAVNHPSRSIYPFLFNARLRAAS